MKNSLKLFAFMFLLRAFCACSPALTVTNDYDHTANFNSYKTFRIVKLEQQYQALSQFNQGRIISAVQAEMTARGLTESQNPDLIVNIVSILKNQKELVANSYGYGGSFRPYAWGGGNMSTTVNVQNYIEGSLIIEVADASSKKLLWEGVGNQNIDQPLKHPDKTIPEAVKKIMAGFPPGSAAHK